MKISLLKPTKYLFRSKPKAVEISLEEEIPLLDSEQETSDMGVKLYNIEVVAVSPRNVAVVEEEREMIHEPDFSRNISKDEREEVSVPSSGNFESFMLDHLCFQYKNPVLEEVVKVEDKIEDDQKEREGPISKLFGGHIFKRTRDDRIGVSIKNSSSTNGIFISKMSISSRLRSSAMLVGMRIATINGITCPKALSAAVELIRSAQGDLKVIAAKEDDPIFASEDSAEEDQINDEPMINSETPLECRRSSSFKSIVHNL
jgi:hypothetical protein